MEDGADITQGQHQDVARSLLYAIVGSIPGVALLIYHFFLGIKIHKVASRVQPADKILSRLDFEALCSKAKNVEAAGLIALVGGAGSGALVAAFTSPKAATEAPVRENLAQCAHLGIVAAESNLVEPTGKLTQP